MKKLLAAAAALAVAAPALAAQFPVRFDAGTSSSPLVPLAGWTPITPASVYPSTHPSTTAVFGWTSGSVVTATDRGSIAPEIVHNHPVELLQDFDHGVGAITFRVDAPLGAYLCQVYLGDVGGPVEDLRITANGIQMADGVFARTINGKATLDGALGGYRRVGFVAPVTDASGIQLTFEGLSSGVPVMGLEIYPYRRPPIVFDHAISGLKRSIDLGDNTELDAGIADYNLALYDDAADHFQDIGLPSPTDDELLAKAYGLAFVVGALTNHQEQVDLLLLDEIVTTLAGLDPNDAAVRNLYVEALDFQLGELFYRTRGYTLAAFPENPDSLSQIVGPGTETGMVLNLSAAVQLLEQMDDDVLEPTNFRYGTESPLHPTARYLIARDLYSRNTKLSIGTTYAMGTACDPNFVDLNDYWLRILIDDLWPVLDANGGRFLFPKAYEAITVCWYFQEYVDLADNVGPPSGPCPRLLPDLVAAWDGTSTPPGVDPYVTWWASQAIVDDTTGAPTWAALQRAHARQFRNLGKWWIDERLRGIELGGGSGDDQEAVLLSVPSITRLESADNPNVEAPLNDIWDNNLLNDPAVNVAEGYFDASGDVEHAAEYTTNPLFALMPTNYGSPRYYEFAMRTMRNLEDLHVAGSPNAWTTAPFTSTTGPLARHFRAYQFGGSAGPTGNRDIPLNMKAVPPGFHLADFNESPTVQRLFEEWAWAWRDAAMRTDNGKPAGFFPAAVTISGGLPGAIGDSGSWWTNGVYSSFPSAYALDHYYLGVRMSRISAATNSDDLLDPLVTAVGALITHNGGDPDATPGTEVWAVGKARKAIATAAWLAKPDLLAAGVNPTALDTAIDDWAALTPAFLNANESATPTNKGEIQAAFQKAEAWFRNFWVFTTTTVSYTDRLKFDIPAYQALYTTPAAASFGLTPTFPISWFDPDSDATTTVAEELDLAILVNKFRPEGGGMLAQMDVLIDNFEAQPRAVGMRAWRGLGLGDYTVEIGPDANGDDVWDTTPSSTTEALDFRGAELSLTVPPGLNLVRLTQTTSQGAGTPEFDLALDPAGIGIAQADGKLHVRVHNLGLNAFDPGSGHAATMKVFVDGVLSTSYPVAKVIPSPEDSASGLDPAAERVVSPAPLQAGPGQLIRVELEVTSGVEITTLNDSLELFYDDIPQV